MKISVLQQNLNGALSIVGRAVPSSTTLPVTQNVLLSTENSMLKISATDLSMAMTTSIGAQVEVEGAITVPARLLTDLVNTLPDDRVDIEFVQDPVGIRLGCGGFTSNISGTPAEDYPPIPTVEDGLSAKIETAVLRQAISRTAFAAASGNDRPVLTGVKVDTEGRDFTFAAADGFRLAVSKGKLAEDPEKDMDFLIPARTLNEIGRLLSSAVDSVKFMVTENNNQALFQVGDVEVVTSLLQGNFPNYMQLVPVESSTKVVMDSANLLKATRTAAIFARESGVVRLRMDSKVGQTTLLAKSEEVGDNQGQVSAAINGADARIAFNYKYLTDVLDVIDGEVELGVNSRSTPGLVKPKDSEEYLHVIMPMFVQD